MWSTKAERRILPMYLPVLHVYTRVIKCLYIQWMAATIPSCLNCEKAIKNGRSDKKFCDSACKDEYYNKIKIEDGKEISKIVGILRRNRKALKKLFDPKKPDLPHTRESLIKAGFEFGFHTHIVITKSKKNEIIFCFNYGYRELSKDRFQIYPTFPKVQIKDGYLFHI